MRRLHEGRRTADDMRDRDVVWISSDVSVRPRVHRILVRECYDVVVVGQNHLAMSICARFIYALTKPTNTHTHTRTHTHTHARTHTHTHTHTHTAHSTHSTRARTHTHTSHSTHISRARTHTHTHTHSTHTHTHTQHIQTHTHTHSHNGARTPPCQRGWWMTSYHRRASA
jgi:hypothetical protein